VRHYFIENARQWLFDFRVDVLRLDAVHAILDTSAYPFLAQLADVIRAEAADRGRTVYLIAESDLNDPRLIRSRERGGHALHAQWMDDFHHAMHTLLTGERHGYYADFGDVASLAKCHRDGYVFTGQYSGYRKRHHGAPVPEAEFHQFVVCTQNHDQVGNRMMGDRFTALLTLDQLKLAATANLTSPFVPLLFMGEEYGEPAPFPYFVSHTEPQLIEAVRNGRKQEFASFQWDGEPPDPQAEATFESARLSERLWERAPHCELLEHYRALLRLRQELRLGHTDRDGFEVQHYPDDQVLTLVRREHEPMSVAVVLSFNDRAVDVDVALPAGTWTSRFPVADEISLRSGGGTMRLQLKPWSALILTQSVAP
jgi:maltooligosyltrehalose trehalohydrolase